MQRNTVGGLWGCGENRRSPFLYTEKHRGFICLCAFPFVSAVFGQNVAAFPRRAARG